MSFPERRWNRVISVTRAVPVAVSRERDRAAEPACHVNGGRAAEEIAALWQPGNVHWQGILSRGEFRKRRLDISVCQFRHAAPICLVILSRAPNRLVNGALVAFS
jgi:hypothetical protein